MPQPLFSVQHLVKRYGDATVVNDLSFDIQPGECLGVIGPNGAGKTTTIRMCLGQTAPDGGRIDAFGLDMPRDALAIKARLGVVSQMDTLDPDFTCAENLLVYGRYFGMKDAAIKARIPQLLEFAALTHKANAKPGELSGGMRRRLSLARALVNDPKLLLLDEPTSGVSAEEKFPMMATIMDALGQEAETTVLFVEHDMDIVERHASRVIAFYAGRVIADDTPAVALAADDVRRYVTGELLSE